MIPRRRRRCARPGTLIPLSPPRVLPRSFSRATERGERMRPARPQVKYLYSRAVSLALARLALAHSRTDMPRCYSRIFAARRRDATRARRLRAVRSVPSPSSRARTMKTRREYVKKVDAGHARARLSLRASDHFLGEGGENEEIVRSFSRAAFLRFTSPPKPVYDERPRPRRSISDDADNAVRRSVFLCTRCSSDQPYSVCMYTRVRASERTHNGQRSGPRGADRCRTAESERPVRM